MGNFAAVMGVILLFILLLVAGLELIDRRGKRDLQAADPEKLLATRFAKGEIDENEYARRLAILRYGPPLELPD